MKSSILKDLISQHLISLSVQLRTTVAMVFTICPHQSKFSFFILPVSRFKNDDAKAVQ